MFNSWHGIYFCPSFLSGCMYVVLWVGVWVLVVVFGCVWFCVWVWVGVYVCSGWMQVSMYCYNVILYHDNAEDSLRRQWHNSLWYFARAFLCPCMGARRILYQNIESVPVRCSKPLVCDAVRPEPPQKKNQKGALWVALPTMVMQTVPLVPWGSTMAVNSANVAPPRVTWSPAHAAAWTPIPPNHTQG